MDRVSTIAGLAIVADDGTLRTTYRAGGYFEGIAHAAIVDAYARRENLRVYWQHEEANPLASESGGTHRPYVTSRGLEFEADLDLESPVGLQAYRAVKRRDISGMSFALYIGDELWSERGDAPFVLVTQFATPELSIVTRPAYTATHVQIVGEQAHEAPARTVSSTIWGKVDELANEHRAVEHDMLEHVHRMRRSGSIPHLAQAMNNLQETQRRHAAELAVLQHEAIATATATFTRGANR